MGSQLFVSNTVAALTLLSSCQTSPKPKRGNAKCASGAKSPEAPNDPCSNMTGRISSLKKSGMFDTIILAIPKQEKSTVFDEFLFHYLVVTSKRK